MGQSVNNHDLRRHEMAGMNKGRLEERSTLQANYFMRAILAHLRLSILTWQFSQKVLVLHLAYILTS
jgi:hypothetical protein